MRRLNPLRYHRCSPDQQRNEPYQHQYQLQQAARRITGDVFHLLDAGHRYGYLQHALRSKAENKKIDKVDEKETFLEQEEAEKQEIASEIRMGEGK